VALALFAVGAVALLLAHAWLPQVPRHPDHHNAVRGHHAAPVSHDGSAPPAVRAAGRNASSVASADEAHEQCRTDGGGRSSPDGEWCDNFVASPTVAVDDRGFICHVDMVRDSGCCEVPPVPPSSTDRHRRFDPDDRCRFFDVTRWDAPAPTTAAAPVPPANKNNNGSSSSAPEAVTRRRSGANASVDLPQTYEDVAEDLELHDGAYCSAEHRCCSMHELCVACCMASGDAFPDKSPAASGFRPCVALCRHTSNSTFHQNQYATPLHHCYTPPTPARVAAAKKAKKRR
jgi:hypothetical protein